MPRERFVRGLVTLTLLRDDLFERDAAHLSHREERRAALVATNVGDGHHARVLELRLDARFANEPKLDLLELAISSNELQRDASPEHAVAAIEHLAHAA